MRCEIRSLNGIGCSGHLGKFADCLAQALYDWSLDDAVADGGASEFEGHVALVAVSERTPCTLEYSGGRIVEVPPGFYLVWSANSGAVTVAEVSSLAAGQEVVEAVGDRWARWEAGCDPDDPAGHEDCGDACAVPGWVDR